MKQSTMANNKCKECGCACKRCASTDHDVHLHVEIENLKQKLVERENHIVTMETTFLNEANKFPSGELVAAREELLVWQDKYRRLYDAHRRVQRVNQGLEDKLLKLVDVCETDKNTLTKDVATLSHKLAEANYTVKKLTADNERYKKDVTLAIQFLQCKQTNFVAHKFDSLPPEVQTQVSAFMTHKRKPEESKRIAYEMKSIKVPIPTFPPTAMVYSVNKSPKPDRKTNAETSPTTAVTIDTDEQQQQQEAQQQQQPQVDIVSAAIMAKVLEERQKDRAFAKHCDTCTCSKKLQIVYDVTHHTVGTQTDDDDSNKAESRGGLGRDESRSSKSFCARCNENFLLQQANGGVLPQLQQQHQNIRLVKNGGELGKKMVPIYPNDVSSESTQLNCNNVAKVQPNNFLVDESSSVAGSEHRSVSRCNEVASKCEAVKPAIKVQNLISQDQVGCHSQSPVPSQSPQNEQKPPSGIKMEHHHLLCTKTTPAYCDHETSRLLPEEEDNNNTDSAKKNSNHNNNLNKSDSSENLKGPRYCSMRLHKGSKNILLDNAHNNVAPVLYTSKHHQHHQLNKFSKKDETAKLHEVHTSHNNTSNLESCSSSSDLKTRSTGGNSAGITSVNSPQTQQRRVADWIQSNLGLSSQSDNSNNSRCESVKDLASTNKQNNSSSLIGSDVNSKVNYAEMEENVKRFLFGESEFLKTVELGKLKYQTYTSNREIGEAVATEDGASKSSARTETEI